MSRKLSKPEHSTTLTGADSEDDWQLFREAVKDAVPLNAEPRVSRQKSPPKPYARQRELDEQAVVAELLTDPGPIPGLESGEELLFLRNGYQRRYLNRLRRGHYAVRDEIDLHGMTVTPAGELLLGFINRAAAQGLGCVRVIHGKGLRSPGLPRLKQMTSRLLRRHPLVIAFASCRPVDGGTGAVGVLLKKPR